MGMHRSAMGRWLAFGLAGLLAACAHVAPPAAGPLQGAGQLVLVTTPGWDADRGTLRRFGRVDGTWRLVGDAVPVMVGRNGTAWGLGLHASQPDGPVKREGDGRAPAGAFAIGTAFGYAADAETALPYAAMDAGDWCIDVPASPLYNRIVDARDVGEASVEGSTEPMRRDLHADGDQRYRLGFVIEHNTQAVPGAGSCIFAHLWKSPSDATAGCTAMADPAMQALLGWLDPARDPVFVLLPIAEFRRLQPNWQLPPEPDA
jgi:L,D-peptidoglycan transpeptidase YkuD (ErfK/YbiS/YcfS/YnhG family)